MEVAFQKIKELLNESNVDLLVRDIKSENKIILKNKYTLEREDIFIETRASEGFSASSDAGVTVGLSLDLNHELILEGIVRDIVRVVQSMRKKAEFAVEDRINISWDFDGQIEEALGKFNNYFKSETLTNGIMEKISDCDYSEIVEINEKKYIIELKKDN